MLIKQGVDISRLNREIRRGLGIAGEILKKYNEEIIITSTFEGNHGIGSLHYGNDAFDMRLPEDFRGRFFNSVMDGLGKNYDVVVMSDHVHIEYDPKGSDKKR